MAWQLLDVLLNIFTCVFTICFIWILLNLQYVLTSRKQHGNPQALGSSQGTTVSACAPRTGTCAWARGDPDALQHLSAQSPSGWNDQPSSFSSCRYSCSTYCNDLGKPPDVGGYFSQIHRPPWTSVWHLPAEGQEVSAALLWACWSPSHLRCWSLPSSCVNVQALSPRCGLEHHWSDVRWDQHHGRRYEWHLC